MVQRIGIFGGTFDPPHLGHLILASEANAELQLDRMLWVLTAVPPHKLGLTISPLKTAWPCSSSRFKRSLNFNFRRWIWIARAPTSRRIPLSCWRLNIPASELILILGGDSLHDLPTWHDPMQLIASCSEIGVMRRPVDSIDLTTLEQKLPGLTSKVKLVDAPLLEIASHEIRERARTGRPFRYFVLPSVYDYIRGRHLYQTS